MPYCDEKGFQKEFNQEWCWKVTKLAHLGEKGETRVLPVFLGRLELGRAENCSFARVANHSRIPSGDYLYLQGIVKSSGGKPSYTRIFISIVGEMFYHLQTDRALIITEHELVGIYPADDAEAEDFLRLDRCPEEIGKLCRMLGKDEAELRCKPST